MEVGASGSERAGIGNDVARRRFRQRHDLPEANALAGHRTVAAHFKYRYKETSVNLR